jgi:group I intron endonuclease
MGYIYLVTNKINNKKYVGQTLRTDINTRWKYHKSNDKRYVGQILHNAYKKYGNSNFEYKIICICFDEDTNKYEKEYISKFNTIYPNGYNLLEGGNNKKHNEYTKKIISSKLKGKNHPNYGKKLKEQHVLNIQKSLEKENIFIEKKLIGRPQNEYTKTKIKEKINEYYKNTTKFHIKQYDLNNNLLNTYYSYSEASTKANINKSYLKRVVNSETLNNTAKGFIWEKINLI